MDFHDLTLTMYVAGTVGVGGLFGYYLKKYQMSTTMENVEDIQNLICMNDSTLGYTLLALCLGAIGLFVGYKLKEHKHKLTLKSILIQKSYENLPHLDRTVDAYVVKHSLREPTPLTALREMTMEEFPGEPMIIDPLEAQLFQMLIHTLDAKKCMEVGAYTGYNAASMALALPDDGTVVVCDITDEYIEAGRPYIEQLEGKIWQKLDIRIQPAFHTMDQCISNHEEFDFIFLDADWMECQTYYEKALMLIRKGGIIAIDNTLCSGRVALSLDKITDQALKREVEALHKMNEGLKTDCRIELVFLQIADGITLCRKLF